MKKTYVMAHRCNTKGWLEQAIKWESNGIECDVTKDNGKFYTWHGDVGGWEELDIYLEHACVQLQNGNGQKVSLFLFDLKYDEDDTIKASDISHIRQKVQEKLLNPINADLGANDAGGLYVFYGIYEGESYAGEFEKSMTAFPLQRREGINYDANRETEPEMALEWKDKNNVTNFLYSSGIFAGGSSPTMWKQLEQAGKLRSSHAFGVYGWTFGEARSAANTVKDYQIDGVLGNMDQDYGWLPTYLSYYGLDSYSLVSRQDMPPFLKKMA